MPQRDPLEPDRSENPEPPSRSPLLFIGTNRRGCWVVRDQSGRRGGLFVSRAEALRFAMFETDYCPQAIVMAPGFLELDLSGPKKVAANDSMAGDRPSPKSTSGGQVHRLTKVEVSSAAPND